jgi:hypothetical protein
MVELKLPGIGLPTIEARAAFIERANAVVAELTVEEYDHRSTFVNVLNAPDGAWGVYGRSWTNEALAAAVSEAAASTA